MSTFVPGDEITDFLGSCSFEAFEERWAVTYEKKKTSWLPQVDVGLCWRASDFCGFGEIIVAAGRRNMRVDRIGK